MILGRSFLDKEDMDQIHKRALRRSRSRIINDLMPDNEFWDKLAEIEIFTPLMMEYIEAEKARPDKVRKLLNDLERRGPHAYGKFIQCLQLSGHGHVANIIQENERALRSPPNEPVLQEPRLSSSVSDTQSTQHNPLHNIFSTHSTGNLDSQYSNDIRQAASGGPITSPSEESQSNVPSTAAIGDTDVNMSSDHVAMATVSDSTNQSAQAQDQSFTGDGQIQSEKIKRYKMTTDPRGFVLIINNINFSNKDIRNGAPQDSFKMKNLFISLGFQVDVKEDLSAQDIFTTLKDLSAFERLHQVDSLIVVLMSHGNNEVIIGTDCERLCVMDLIKLFDADHCPAMMTKPKMFIVNACRGDDKDYGRIKFGATRPSYDRLELDSGPNSFRRQPANSDFLIAYSTFPGFVSLRDDSEGSWFIQCFVDIFSEFAREEHVMDMLTQVNDKVAEMSENQHGFNQTPAPMSTLRGKWYLNPPSQN